MPYFNQPMAQSIMSGSGQPPPERTKQLRSMPGNAPNGASVVFKNSEASFHDRYRYEVSKRKLLFMRSLIQAQVTQLMLSPPLTSIDADAKRFNTYHIHQKNRIYEDSHLKMFRVTNKSIELPLMVRIYSRQEVDPNNSMYIKILRHLGRKHPKIVYSFDLFVDAKSIYVFQEYLAFGNLLEYLDKSPSVTENQARFWAKQLFDSLDFLGDQGIAHCNLNPTHLLIRQIGKEIWIKLTGFQRAIVYWNLQTNDIKRCPCFPAETQKADGPNFMAPETYGNPTSEEYDPILADTWSYGANVYYMLASQYPFNLHGPMEDLDGEILANIRQLPTLNADGQDFLYSTMRANANDRMPFDFIGRNSW